MVRLKELVVVLFFFSIYANDLTCDVTSKASVYADDLKIYKAIKSADDAIGLQADINLIQNLSDKWKLPLNKDKILTQFRTKKRL